LIFSPWIQSLSAVNYYIDSEAGNDSSSGVTEATAWKSLQQVQRTVYQPGDQILFKKGCSWLGQLSPQGSGKENAAIVIGSYGSGDLPKIKGNGSPYALGLKNQEYWEIRELDISNPASEAGDRVGVLILGESGPETLHHIYLQNLHVHDVRGALGTDSQARTTGGIGFEIRGYKENMRFDDIRIQNCEVQTVDSCGIYTWTDFRTHPRDTRWEKLRFTKVKVASNHLTDIGKNAIVVRSSWRPLIENNRVDKAAARIHGNAIYLYGCKDGVMQKNEVSGTQFLENKEGAALDSDYKSEGTIIQYNFSHDNGGGLVNFCNNPQAKEGDGYNDGTIVRYNISQNDIHRVFGFDGPVTRTRIYNNTIYVGAGLAPKIYDIDRFGKAEGYASEVLSLNNIIVNKGKGSYRLEHGTGLLFENNCFYGNHPKDEPADAKKMKADPQFSAAVLNPKPGQVPEYFRLALGSPCAGAGIKIPDNGGRDFWGNPVDSAKPSIGASE
jgi:hypothetical protein